MFGFILVVCALGVFLTGICSSGIKGPPHLIGEVESREAHEGETVRLVCPIKGNPEPMIQWFKDGETITDAAWLRFRVSSHTLKIRNVEREDAGVYVCKGVNGFGSKEVAMTFRVVASELHDPDDVDDFETLMPSGGDIGKSVGTNREPKLVHVTREGNGDVILKPAGSHVKLKCVAEGEPPPVMVWYKDGELIKGASTSVHLSSEGLRRFRGFILLNHVTSLDSGNYVCDVRNSLGDARAHFNLQIVDRVRSAPDLEAVVPVNASVLEGQSAAMQCKIKSTVLPHVHWLKRLDNKDIDEEARNATIEVEGKLYKVVNESGVFPIDDNNMDDNIAGLPPEEKSTTQTYLSKLLIPRVRVSDGGTYVCLAANTMGFAYKEAILNVIPIIPITDGPLSNLATSTSDSINDAILLVGIPLFLVTIVATLGICLLKRRQNKKASRTPSTTLNQPELDDARNKLTTAGNTADPHQQRYCQVVHSGTQTPKKLFPPTLPQLTDQYQRPYYFVPATEPDENFYYQTNNGYHSVENNEYGSVVSFPLQPEDGSNNKVSSPEYAYPVFLPNHNSDVSDTNSDFDFSKHQHLYNNTNYSSSSSRKHNNHTGSYRNNRHHHNKQKPSHSSPAHCCRYHGNNSRHQFQC